MIDFSLDNKSAEKNNDIDLILQQIDILFDTTPKEILGQERYGSIYDTYLYKLNISNEDLRCQVVRDINSLELFNFKPSVEVIMLQGTERDIALIKIVLTRELESYEKTYKIT